MKRNGFKNEETALVKIISGHLMEKVIKKKYLPCFQNYHRHQKLPSCKLHDTKSVF